MAKSTTSNISIRMDSDLKAAAEALYEELGMNLSTAFNIFVRQSLRERGIPFKITEGTPSKETGNNCGKSCYTYAGRRCKNSIREGNSLPGCTAERHPQNKSTYKNHPRKAEGNYL